MPWWAAVLVGFGLAGLGAIIDIQSQDELGLLFKACYFVGAVGAIAIVRRCNVFAPMVQPPLIIGIIVPVVVLLASGLPEGSDTLATALAVGMPLIKGFPTMAITTGLVVVIGVVRIYRERDPNRPAKPVKSGGSAGRRESESNRTAPPAKERQAGQRGQAQRRRPPESPGKSDPHTPGSKAPPPGRERGQGGKPPQERPGSTTRKPPDRRQGPPPQGGPGERGKGKQPPEDEPRRRRRPPEQQDRSGKQPPPKSAQPPRSPQQQQRREEDPPPRRQPPKRPWDDQDR